LGVGGEASQKFKGSISHPIEILWMNMSLLNDFADFLLKIWEVAKTILFIAFVAVQEIPTIDTRVLGVFKYVSDALNLSSSNTSPEITSAIELNSS
jgi:hypothetical protein